MRHIKNSLLPFLISSALLLLLFQTFSGKYGAQARAELRAHIAGLEKKRMILQKKRQRLERVTKLFAPDAVDRDMLEFRARELLGFVHENEQVYVRRHR